MAASATRLRWNCLSGENPGRASQAPGQLSPSPSLRATSSFLCSSPSLMLLWVLHSAAPPPPHFHSGNICLFGWSGAVNSTFHPPTPPPRESGLLLGEPSRGSCTALSSLRALWGPGGRGDDGSSPSAPVPVTAAPYFRSRLSMVSPNSSTALVTFQGGERNGRGGSAECGPMVPMARALSSRCSPPPSFLAQCRGSTIGCPCLTLGTSSCSSG